MSTRDIQKHVAELYGLSISPDLVSAVTDAVLDEVTAWQNRPLEPVYAIVFFDAVRVKIRDEGNRPMIPVVDNSETDQAGGVQRTASGWLRGPRRHPTATARDSRVI